MEVFKLWIRTLQLFKTGVAIKKGFLDIDRPFLSQLISSEPDFLCYFGVTSKTSFSGGCSCFENVAGFRSYQQTLARP